MHGEFERLASDAALRALDKQERLLEELRNRTGVLLAASSLAVSFLGRDAFTHSTPVPVVGLALLAFLVSIMASVYVLAPKHHLAFSLSGPELYERLYSVRMDSGEVHRRLAYDLHRCWEDNDQTIVGLIHAYRVAAGTLVVEVVLLAVLISGSLF
jgi:hypothetical protein